MKLKVTSLCRPGIANLRYNRLKKKFLKKAAYTYFHAYLYLPSSNYITSQSAPYKPDRIVSKDFLWCLLSNFVARHYHWVRLASLSEILKMEALLLDRTVHGLQFVRKIWTSSRWVELVYTWGGGKGLRCNPCSLMIIIIVNFLPPFFISYLN